MIHRRNLAPLGWVEAHNVLVDYRFSASTIEQSESKARELLVLQPDVIIGHGTPAVAALQRTTSTIPIVFVVVSEPVAQGFVDSLAHPGGNITGLSFLEASLGGKWLELLKTLAPKLTRAATIFNPKTATNAKMFFEKAQSSGYKLVIDLIESPVHDPIELEDAMVRLAREPGGGMIILPDVFTGDHRRTIFERAAHHQLPAIYAFPNYAVEGGLISYGVDITDLYRRSVIYIDRLLRGAKPSDLPVEQPTKFELVINLKTAKALGLEVAPSLLTAADKLIE